MTVVLRDTFTGGDDTDIDGRIPDGGGAGPLAIGAWDRQYGVSAGDTLDIVGGVLVAGLNVGDSTYYRVTGHGLASADYAVRLKFTPTVPSGGFGSFFGVTMRATGTGSECYLFEIADFGADGYTWSLYWVGPTGNVFALDSDTTTTPFTPGEHSIQISGVGTTLRGWIDDVVVATGTDPDYTGIGDPGVEAANADDDTHDVAISRFEVDDDPESVFEAEPPPPDPCEFLWSRHLFLGSRADVNSQRTDTYPGQGIWDRHPSSVASLANDWLVGRVVGAGRAVYLDRSIPDLPDDYCVEVTATYPEVTTPGTPGDPGDPGTDPYVEPWRYTVTDGAGTVYEDGLVSDLATDTTFTYGSPAGVFELADLVRWPNGQPKSWDWEYSGGDVGTGGGRLYLIFYTTVHKTATGSHSYPLTVTWDQARDPTIEGTDDFSNYGANLLLNGTPSTSIPMGPQNIAPAHTYPPFYYPLGLPATDTRTLSSTAASPVIGFELLGEPTSASAGRITVTEWAEMELDGTTPFDLGTPATPDGDPVDVGEVASTELRLRYDAAADTGYVFRQTFDHSDTGTEPAGLYELEARSAGVATLLRSLTLDLAHDTAYGLEFQVAGTVLRAMVGGGVLWTFDVATDTADATGLTVADHTTGDPGLGGTDASETGDYLELTEFQVHAATDVTIPCEGDPDNPYPTDPPPGDPTDVTRIWVMRQGDWRPLAVPGSNTQAPGIIPTARGARRSATGLSVYARGQWRTIEEPTSDQHPPPETPLPPFFDPCDLVPETNPDTVTPIPLTGRFFGMGNLPVSMLGPLFTGTTIASGFWTESDIATCATKGCTLVTNLGGYKRFLVGGEWSLATYKAWVLSDLVPLLSVMQAGTLDGSFYGYSAFDDFTSTTLWPPSGISFADIVDVVDFLHTHLPDVRIGIRGLPSQFTTHPGVDFYQAQYVAWATRWTSAADFQATEQGLAVSRGAQILLNLNYVHGGNGSSGIQIVNGTMLSGHYAMSPAEVMAYADDIFVDGTGLAGSLGYQNNAVFLAQPGIIDALAYARNVLAAL